MKAIGELPEDVQPIAIKAQKLREQNSARIGRLESMGFGVEVNNARLEHFMDKLVDAGVLSDEQLWAICLDWEEGLETQIIGMENSIRERAMENAKQLRRQKLAGPGAGGLLLPDGRTVRPKADGE